MPPEVSVLIRALNEARDIGRVLDLLDAQTIAERAETIVVDSGSTDGTLDIARPRVDKLLEIPQEAFTYGYALNVGTRAAEAPVVVALSAHAFPRDARFLEQMLRHFEAERVACASGMSGGPRDEPADRVILQDIDMARRWPFWGYSHVAGGFRRELWEQRPFREDMPYTEDKEWAWHWMQRGMVVAMDPAIDVDHVHVDEGFLESYRRARSAWAGYRMFLDVPPLRARELARTWWSQGGGRSRLRARLSPRRTGWLVGEFVARRGAITRPPPAR